MTKEHQSQKVAVSHVFTAVKSVNGMYDVCAFSIRPSDGPVMNLTIPARDLPDFERNVRQAATAHRLAVEEEKAAKLRSAATEIEKLAIALSMPARTSGIGWWGLSDSTRAEYTKQAEELYAIGWRREGEYLK